MNVGSSHAGRHFCDDSTVLSFCTVFENVKYVAPRRGLGWLESLVQGFASAVPRSWKYEYVVMCGRAAKSAEDGSSKREASTPLEKLLLACSSSDSRSGGRRIYRR